jgi:hypothetical protein
MTLTVMLSKAEMFAFLNHEVSCPKSLTLCPQNVGSAMNHTATLRPKQVNTFMGTPGCRVTLDTVILGSYCDSFSGFISWYIERKML